MSDAIMGTFVSIKTMADGTPRITIDLDCTLSDASALGLTPGAPFALARLTQEATQKEAQKQVAEPKEKPGQLCVMACNFCSDHLFLDYFGLRTEEEAKDFLISYCGVSSRKELDSNSEAGRIFLEKIRGPFLEWKRQELNAQKHSYAKS